MDVADVRRDVRPDHAFADLVERFSRASAGGTRIDPE
jgi:hypothetical protein